MRLLLVKIIFLILLSLSLPGCETLQSLGSDDSEDGENYSGWDAKKFHEKARAAMDAGNYNEAIKLYEALEARYPFGPYAAQTQLDIAYAYYKNDDPEAAIAAADRFIKFHPRNPSVDYAYYLKGLVNYNRSIGFLDRFLPTDRSQRDPGNARLAYENFAELIRRFPDSKYVPDARQRMIALKNNLAMYEIHVARFYMKRRAYIAAASRANHVIEDFQRTPAVPHALKILEQAYTKLNLKDLAADAQRVFAQNYPNGLPDMSHGEKTIVEHLWDMTGFDE